MLAMERQPLASACVQSQGQSEPQGQTGPHGQSNAAKAAAGIAKADSNTKNRVYLFISVTSHEVAVARHLV